MSDATKSGKVPLLGSPMMLPGDTWPPRFWLQQALNHGPGEYCFFCSCQDCRMFYGRGAPIRCIHPCNLELSRPKYSYMGFVNSMRAAFAKREEDRQAKLRTERAGTAAAAEAPKKEKTSKDQIKKKNLRQNMKRRRQ